MAINLPRLPRDVPIVDAKGAPTLEFQRWWQATTRAIEDIEARVKALEP